MQHRAEVWFEYLLETWRDASPLQYAILVLVIVVSGWLVSRFTPS